MSESTQRRRLPNRRISESFDLESQGLRFTCTASRFADGTLAEIFLTNHRAGSKPESTRRMPRWSPQSPCNSACRLK